MSGAFRSVGIEARITPHSSADTLELGGLVSSGEECLPHKVTVGDFLRICREPGFDPQKVAFFMPTAQGPCRFGQYAPYLRRVLQEQGLGDVLVLSPSSADGYDGLGDSAGEVMRSGWMALVVGDILAKFQLKTRPYELTAGDTDALFEEQLESIEAVMAKPNLSPSRRIARLQSALIIMRDCFRAIPARYEPGRPLIGLVGEIFCRLNTFSNEDVARRIERLGGECWLSDISEWVWYTNWRQQQDIVTEQGRFNLDYLKHCLKTHKQHGYEHSLYAAVRQDLIGYEEPQEVGEILRLSEPFLPPQGCLGEMVLSVGKTIYLYGKGADGIIDISPFTCMNGVVCEAIYPSVSGACELLPIRNLYFDGVNRNVERDLEIFLDLARAYQRRKTRPRRYPAYFEGVARLSK
ncbi:MAG: hypothetical protein HJJLKODD_02974 [Phycisphaerae bacterium]|nr:hypothetical protein [Phycisphaerae bacterium]